MASRVFVKVGSKVAGPFSLSQIKQLAAQGKINPATPICPEIGGKPNNEWRKAAAIKGVFQNGKIQNEVNTSNKVASPAPRKATAPSPQVSVEEGKSHRYLLIGSVVGIGAFALCAIAFMFWYSSAKKQEKIAAANEKVNQTVILVEDFLNGERSVDIETVEKRLARALENSQATNLKKAEAAESKLKQKKEEIQLEKAAAEQFAKAKKAIDSFKTKAAIRILAEYVENPHAKQQAEANTLLSQATYADSDEAAMKMLLTASDEQFARMQSDTPLPHPEIQNSAILKHWNKTVRKNYNLAVSKRRENRKAQEQRQLANAKRRQQREQEEAAARKLAELYMPIRLLVGGVVEGSSAGLIRNQMGNGPEITQYKLSENRSAFEKSDEDWKSHYAIENIYLGYGVFMQIHVYNYDKTTRFNWDLVMFDKNNFQGISYDYLVAGQEKPESMSFHRVPKVIDTGDGLYVAKYNHKKFDVDRFSRPNFSLNADFSLKKLKEIVSQPELQFRVSTGPEERGLKFEGKLDRRVLSLIEELLNKIDNKKLTNYSETL